MEKHATEDADKATFIMCCINGQEGADAFQKKHSLKNVVQLIAEAPAQYGLKYIPHHVVFDGDGKVLMNYDKPSRDYMSFL